MPRPRRRRRVDRGALLRQGSRVYLATLVNPVDHELYVAVMRSVNNVEILSTDEGRVVAGGFIQWEDATDVVFPATRTIRVHTLPGVKKKGVGLGLLLYVGCALAASFVGFATPRKLEKHRIFEDLYGFGRRRIQGIYSEAWGRSEDAEAWWVRQRERGLARVKCIPASKFDRPERREFERLDVSTPCFDLLLSRDLLKIGIVAGVCAELKKLPRKRIPREVLGEVDIEKARDPFALRVYGEAVKSCSSSLSKKVFEYAEMWDDMGYAHNPIPAWEAFYGTLVHPDD